MDIFSRNRRIVYVPSLSQVFLLFLFFYLTGGSRSYAGTDAPTPESVAASKARTIQLAMFQYQNDHGGNYPTGKSSTEIFQKLVDGNYLTEMEIYFLPMPGKTIALGKHLQSQNVCFDVTTPVTEGSSPDDLPTVFATGYRMEYKLGGKAVLLPDRPSPDVSKGGIAVAFKDNDSKFCPVSNGVVPSVIPVYAPALHSTYVQLTPDGALDPK